jgi:hypothetical protein
MTVCQHLEAAFAAAPDPAWLPRGSQARRDAIALRLLLQRAWVRARTIELKAAEGAAA